MEKQTIARCPNGCEGTGYYPVADSGGEGIEFLECRYHHPAYRGKLTAAELLHWVESVTDISTKVFKNN
jgi:hypothetical protein